MQCMRVSVIHYIPDLKRLEHVLVKFDTTNNISIYKVIAHDHVYCTPIGSN